ncbi:DNA-binding NarL/FixJ family response regulator [Breznakibacter xylanolyticus]|uniref:DNA-binding NarL/FixJ family response regulator n=1 Tax=Breznakibacter xylanolyticus TaxID=990 RepID=A0A2W7NFM1_9BACT|nr:response regulator transcription factor [Breznakibacter xylanolyticus]PZX19181.1 DNA-binding NarL/FixJ family response regulator [Breznakibacter xylanolyticus]
MNVILAEPSYIIRKGFIHLLREFPEIETIIECSKSDDLEHHTQEHPLHLIIANTSFEIPMQEDLDENSVQPVVMYLFNTPLPQGASQYHLSVYEGKSTLAEKLQHAIQLCKTNNNGEQGEELSPREKLVLKHVALGQTNKEIADQLFISTHTVISHRKNITKKLGIKTVSGLTVYAILNKLIGMEDIS